MYHSETDGVAITVIPEFLAHESSPDRGLFVWAYHIEITNRSPETVQLLSRYWHITDSSGRVQEVRGAGVVGKQPVLPQGANFAYSSSCPLQTSSGIMRGTFLMIRQDGSTFHAEIPAFSLDMPQAPRVLN